MFSSIAFAACRTINSDTMEFHAGVTDVDDAAEVAQPCPFLQHSAKYVSGADDHTLEDRRGHDE